MGVRLLEMKRVLKSTGSIYLHCDTFACHYLKMLMDAVFGHTNFRNQIVWRIGWLSGFKTQKRGWIRNHDIILYYVKSPAAIPLFNKEYLPYATGYVRRDGKAPTGKGIPIEDTWNCSAGDILDSINIMSFSREKLGYPTQKNVNLLERIVNASSQPGDLILDPFCGCGTALYAAEKLHRRWIGVDISRYSASLVQNRLLANSDNFKVDLKPNDILVYGLPTTVSEARNLVIEMDGRFEFDKWVCGVLGTSNMLQRKKPGKRGADGGVDGLLKFFPIRTEAVTQGQREVDEAYAVIQVKSGNVSADAVRALTQVIEDTPGAIAAVLVAFEDQRSTFNNNASQEMIDGILGEYRKIQFPSVEQLLDLPQNPTFLPNIIKMGGKSEAVKLPETEGIEDAGTLSFS